METDKQREGGLPPSRNEKRCLFQAPLAAILWKAELKISNGSPGENEPVTTGRITGGCAFAGHWTFTSICLALAASTLGRVTKSIPSLESAVIFFVSTNGGSVKLRKNWP